MIDKTYRCNLCRDMLPPKDHGFGIKGIGIWWGENPGRWMERPYREVENHLCFRCVVSIQSLKKICNEGFECSGGIKCQSDHK